ncbi:ribosomal protein L3, putative, partial [Leishmania donovani]
MERPTSRIYVMFFFLVFCEATSITASNAFLPCLALKPLLSCFLICFFRCSSHFTTRFFRATHSCWHCLVHPQHSKVSLSFGSHVSLQVRAPPPRPSRLPA